MATPNYGYEKRQRELAKKKKKEEKLRAKAAGRQHGDTGSDAADGASGDEVPGASGPAADADGGSTPKA